MEEKFDVIAHLSGLTMFVFDKDVLVRVARDNGVYGVTDYDGVDKDTWLRCERDLLMTVAKGPWSTASHTNQHGAFTITIGSQTITSNALSNIISRIKWLNKTLGEEEQSEELPEYGAVNEWVNEWG